MHLMCACDINAAWGWLDHLVGSIVNLTASLSFINPESWGNAHDWYMMRNWYDSGSIVNRHALTNFFFHLKNHIDVRSKPCLNNPNSLKYHRGYLASGFFRMGCSFTTFAFIMSSAASIFIFCESEQGEKPCLISRTIVPTANLLELSTQIRSDQKTDSTQEGVGHWISRLPCRSTKRDGFSLSRVELVARYGVAIQKYRPLLLYGNMVRKIVGRGPSEDGWR